MKKQERLTGGGVAPETIGDSAAEDSKSDSEDSVQTQIEVTDPSAGDGQLNVKAKAAPHKAVKTCKKCKKRVKPKQLPAQTEATESDANIIPRKMPSPISRIKVSRKLRLFLLHRNIIIHRQKPKVNTNSYRYEKNIV